MSFDQGNVVDAMRAETLPTGRSVTDDRDLASAVLSYELNLKPNRDTVIYIAVPLHETLPACVSSGCHPRWASAQLDSTVATWTRDLGKTTIQLPRSYSRIPQSIRSNLAYILINRDGPAIQPGSRSYERSWIRDGSLTSAALLRLGHYKEVADFINWYAGYQFDNGKIPCCVDGRGSDPVPENDSHGEFIYLVAEYFRHTGDRTMLVRMWPHVSKAFDFMDSLRQSRTTPEFQAGEKVVFYGLMPQSISHEGYSAKPMHSYWDDFFALRGFKDAAFIAETLGKTEAIRYAEVSDRFRTDLHASIKLAMENHDIDYVPGAAELGDFDATSTTVGVNPAGELGSPLDSAIRRTFDRYYSEFNARAGGVKPWDIYTPYEWRVAGTFVRLGQRDRAYALLGFFFEHQRPKEWHQWAEVVMHKADSAHFIGDMPHTWVGSDFIRSALDMFAFERDSDSSLVIAGGVPLRWIREDEGLRVDRLSTHYGLLSYSMRAIGTDVQVRIESGIRIPSGGVVILPPFPGKPRQVLVNGASVPVQAGPGVRINALPASVTIRY
jgi:hypothetical protein